MRHVQLERVIKLIFADVQDKRDESAQAASGRAARDEEGGDRYGGRHQVGHMRSFHPHVDRKAFWWNEYRSTPQRGDFFLYRLQRPYYSSHQS